MFIKPISLSDTHAKQHLLSSFQETGFAVLVDHGIEPTSITSALNVWKDFFASEAKINFLYNPENQSGFFPMNTESAKGQDLPDLKEFFHYYPNYPIPETCLEATAHLRSELVALGGRLLSWLDETLPNNIQSQLSQPLQSMIVDSPNILFRSIHYPPLKQVNLKEAAVRAAAHEDINLITLLPAASAPGLQVLDKKGNWHDVSCDPGMIVVNIGDMLQEATQDYLPSTTHRVINPNSTENISRYSTPLFLHAHPKVILSERYTAAQYLEQRLIELGLKKDPKKEK